MRSSVPVFDSGTIESISRIVGEAYTNDQLTRLLRDSGLGDSDPGEGGTKWRRIANAVDHRQSVRSDGNPLLSVAKTSIQPGRRMASRYEGDAEALQRELNAVLSTQGFKLQEDGRLVNLRRKATYSEAKAMARNLREHLEERGSHEQVLKHCREDLLQRQADYYELVFEAAKGLEERLRFISGSDRKGRNLPQYVLGKKNRIVPINLGGDETKDNEQDSIALLAEGVIAGFRNPPAHETRLRWQVSESDAKDILGLMALIHRRLDTAVEIMQSGDGRSG